MLDSPPAHERGLCFDVAVNVRDSFLPSSSQLDLFAPWGLNAVGGTGTGGVEAQRQGSRVQSVLNIERDKAKVDVGGRFSQSYMVGHKPVHPGNQVSDEIKREKRSAKRRHSANNTSPRSPYCP